MLPLAGSWWLVVTGRGWSTLAALHLAVKFYHTRGMHRATQYPKEMEPSLALDQLQVGPRPD